MVLTICSPYIHTWLLHQLYPSNIICYVITQPHGQYFGCLFYWQIRKIAGIIVKFKQTQCMQTDCTKSLNEDMKFHAKYVCAI